MDNYMRATGNLVDDPELRFTPSGVAVAQARLACTKRYFDRDANEWKDGSKLFISTVIWRNLAENSVAQLEKGSRVTVEGKLTQRSYETREGEKRTVFELVADALSQPVSKGGGSNHIRLRGNLVDTVEKRDANGTPVARFRLASTERIFDRDANEWKDGKTVFIDVVAWRALAEAVEGMPKGTLVSIEGEMQERSYETKEGEKRTAYEIVASEVSRPISRAAGDNAAARKTMDGLISRYPSSEAAEKARRRVANLR